MLKKIKKTLTQQKLNIEALLAKINFSSAKLKTSKSLRTFLTSIDESTKKEIHDWLQEIKSIKNDSDLSASRKEDKVSQVRTSQTVLVFIKSLIEVLVSKIPGKGKGLAKAGLFGAGIAISILNIEVSAIGLLILSKALPKFIMSSKFDELSAWIEKELPLSQPKLIK